MFRLPFFRSRTRSQRSKKTAPLPTEAMQKTLEDYNTSKPKVHEGNNAGSSPSSTGQDRKPGELKRMNDSDSEHSYGVRVMRKCASLGGELVSYQDMTSGEDSSSSVGNLSRDEYWKARAAVSPQISSNLVNHASDSSFDHLQGCDEEIGDGSETRLSGACTNDSSSRALCTPHHFVKSNSSPYLHLAQASVYSLEREGENDSAGHAEKYDDECDGDDDEAYDYTGLAKDWIVPAEGEPHKCKNVHEDNSVCQLEELHTEDFKMKRIEEWVMDLQHSSSLDETNMITDPDHHGRNSRTTTSNSMAASKKDAKATPGMDAAKLYISSLNAAATTAQLANHGLVVIPFLSAFSSLRALNLSGNSIVRITVGALPRGLHVLNLSKNSISTIEGLRELTRLRVLDLSYNRIVRIGHGLASCSSLKELYLAGNRIGEVEGLHRLLKLSVLDLRFNKLSTTKNLGQLAANYNSLQAISLEGNPAQKNIGDEQLKKFLLGLLPHVAYFNRQSLKSGAGKDLADRAARIGISAHQADRGLRSESKSKRCRKSQGVSSRGQRVRLPPSGVRSKGHRQRFPDRASPRPDLAMRRAHSEGMLRVG